MNVPILPDFICIGAQKAGTTWLYEQLRRHPDVWMPGKEPNTFYRAKRWVREAVPPAGRVIGDISPVYGAAPGVAERIARLCPGARIVMVLRDPVARAWSQYRMAVRLGNIPAGRTFREAFASDCRWLARRGRYAEIIGEYQAFGDRMLLVDFRRIATEPAAVIAEVCDFLGIGAFVDSEAVGTRYAAARDSRAIDEADAAAVAEYYRPHNGMLRDLVPWRADWMEP